MLFLPDTCGDLLIWTLLGRNNGNPITSVISREAEIKQIIPCYRKGGRKSQVHCVLKGYLGQLHKFPQTRD